MNKRDVRGTFIILLLVIYTIVFRNYIADKYVDMYYAITSAFMAFTLAISFIFFGYHKLKFNSVKKNTIILLFIVLVVYFIAIYGIGYVTGYEQNTNDLSLNGIVNNVLGVVILITTTELLRYIFISSNRDKKYLIILFTIIISLIEFNLSFENIKDVSLQSIFYLTTTTIIPIFVKNMLLSYLSYNLGFIPCIIYNVVMSIYMFIIPVLPNINNYFVSMLGIIIPFIIYVFTSRMLTEYYDKTTPEFNHRVFSIIDIPIGILIVVIIIFISGMFRYFLIGVASESMTPTILKGDAILVDKSAKVDDMNIGDVIAYNNGDKVIIHRIVSITNNDEGIKVVDTKGDANNTNDNVELKDDDIVGRMIIRVPYLAWPTIWFREVFG